MEQSQFETLNPSVSLFPFPPHRRRHLKSETFCTLVRILSHCNGESQCFQSHQLVPEEQKRGTGENELGQATEGEVCGEPVGPSTVESEISSIQRDGPNSTVFGTNECVNEDRMETDELDNVGRITEELIQENIIALVNTLEEKNSSGNVVSLTDNQESQISLQEICMEELGNVGQVVVDQEYCNRKVTEALSFDIDMIAESQKQDESNEEGSLFVERDVLEEVGHEMHAMELEKSISNCGAINSPLCETADEEIEEGEISGDFGVYDLSMDFLLEDAASLEKEKVDEEHTSEAITNEEQITCKKQKGANQEGTKSNKNFVGTADNAGNGMEWELRESNISEMECKSEMVVFGKYGGVKLPYGYDSVIETERNEKQATRANQFNHPAVPGEISGQNVTENQGTLSTEKDADVNKKKKRGPLTKEKKAKKKQKERIKRAEKNRRLGVKRLKIQPVLKPKTVTYCRHYMKGRCQEGDKCKFSHDTIPLTKSKPCCHFARHSCMKGDDCPFDHELSKYPCNNYLSKGSCSRGADCMFSHEMPPPEDSPSTINVSKPDLKLSFPLRATNSEKQLKSHNSSHQKVDSKSGSIVISSRKNTEQNMAETILKPAVQTPKGISKLLFGKSSLCNPSKLNQAGPSPKAYGVKVGLPMIHSTPDMAQNSNEITKMTAAVESKGINFLSFGKAPLHDSSSKKSSSLPFSREHDIQKSTSGDSSKDKQAASSPKKDEDLKIGIQTGQSARNMVRNLSETPNRTPAVPPRGMNFLSFGKAPLDNASNKKLSTGPSNGDSDVASSVQETGSAPKLHIPSSKPWRLLSSSLPSDQPLDRKADEHGKDTPSSSLKALLSNTPNSAQKSLMSTLAFAAKYKSKIKTDRPAVGADFIKESSSSQNTSGGSTIFESSSSQNTSRGSTIFDLLYGAGSKAKQ